MNRIKQYFSNFCYATSIIFCASKRYFILKLVLSLVSSILPYLPLFLWKNLINAIVDVLSGNSASLLKATCQTIFHQFELQMSCCRSLHAGVADC